MRDKPEHLAAHVFAVDGMDVESIEKCRRRRDTFFLVVHRPNATIEERSRRGLAEVVCHRAEHDDELIRAVEIINALARLVDHLQRVHPHITFRVPFRLLFTPHERFQLGKQLIDNAEFEREGETD
jgi:hypothetical protein